MLFLKKNKIIELIDKIKLRLILTKFFIDSPTLDYQPLPWIGINKAYIRGEATMERWNSIKTFLNDSKSLKDLGCCVGYFCHSSASELNIHSFGFDQNSDFIFIANHTKSFVKNGEKEVFCKFNMVESNMQFLPKTDASLVLSIWHHWVFNFGLDSATKMLQEVWKKTEKILFFESGEEEVIDEFKIPVTPGSSASDWLKSYLIKTLENSKVDIISSHYAGNYNHYKKKHARTLFCISRNA